VKTDMRVSRVKFCRSVSASHFLEQRFVLLCRSTCANPHSKMVTDEVLNKIKPSSYKHPTKKHQPTKGLAIHHSLQYR
jgi:hypothetical protein